MTNDMTVGNPAKLIVRFYDTDVSGQHISAVI